jgi:hypothetical protein
MLNSNTVSTELEGNGGQLLIPISVDVLPQGENEINISAKMSTCDPLFLTNTATLIVVKKAAISGVKDGSSCEDGSVNLVATGLDASLYNWYESEGDAESIAGQHANEFTTPVLTKSKTYYVAAVNALGCEGDRVAVKATITILDPVMITAEGNMLTSNYAAGNQWYLDGLPIENANEQEIEAIVSGVYSVTATVGACSKTSEGRELLVTGMEMAQTNFINVYPNPTTDKITIEVRSLKNIEARLIHPSGMQVSSIVLSGLEVKSGEFSMLSLPDGIYLVRIHEGHKVFTKKISKVK